MISNKKELRFCIGMLIAVVGTCLAAYVMPEAFRAYSWWVLVIALLIAASFSAFLYICDTDLVGNVRLRNFLRFYLSAVCISMLAPSALPNSVFLLGTTTVGRLLSILPIVAVFVAMIAAYTSPANVSDVVVHHSSRDNN